MATAIAAKLPSKDEANIAEETSRVLASHVPNKGPLQLRILGDAAPEATFKLPEAAVRLLLRILEEMARGNAVSLIPIHAELTTQEAAEMLNISRPTLIQLLETGRIKYRRVGSHRRIRLEDLIRFKRQADADRRAVLEQLAAYDQELGI